MVYEEMVIECKTMYAAPFDPKNFKSEVPQRQYSLSTFPVSYRKGTCHLHYTHYFYK